MPRIMIDLIVVVLVLLIGASLIYKSDTATENEISGQIKDIETGGNGETPIEDGGEEIILYSDSGNGVAKFIYEVSDVISGAISYSFEIIVGGFKNIFD